MWSSTSGRHLAPFAGGLLRGPPLTCTFLSTAIDLDFCRGASRGRASRSPLDDFRLIANPRATYANGVRCAVPSSLSNSEYLER